MATFDPSYSDEHGPLESALRGAFEPGPGQGRRRAELIKARLFGAELAAPSLGRYRLLGELGEGGMGIVYSAYDEQLDRRVAIKLLASDRAGSELERQRLLHEAQAMAKLSHPNVVQVYEAGTFASDVYVVMEFVRGTTLRAWAQAKPRSADEIVATYLEAGRGLAAAHEAGLVHRDFKPDNVLVGDDGRVRVSDFGLARRTDGESTADGDVQVRENKHWDAAVPETATGCVLGTPAYMSPEQHRGEKADARSDQFSFCVALFETLFNERPFRGGSLAMLALEKSSGDVESVLGHRRISSSVRRVLLRGLSPDPGDRYLSMNELLAHLVPRARTGTRRIVAGSFVGALSVALWLVTRAGPCDLAGRDFEGVWNSSVQAAVSTALSDTAIPYAQASATKVLAELDEYAQSWRASALDSCTASKIHNTQSNELLDRRTACLARRKRAFDRLVGDLVHAPAVLAEHAVAAVDQLPRVDSCDRTERLLRGDFGVEDVASEDSLLVEATLLEARSAERLGEYTRAVELARTAVEGAKRAELRVLLAEALRTWGALSVPTGDTQAAVDRLLEAADLSETIGHDELLAEVWAELVELARSKLSDPARGEQWLRRAQAVTARLGPDLRRDNRVRRGRAGLHSMQGELGLARAELEAAVELARGLPETTLVLPDTLVELANVEGLAGDKTRALATYAQAESTYVERLGAQHPRVARVLFNTASLLIDTGDLERATSGFERARAIFEQAYGPESLEVGKVHYARAAAELAVGQLDRAREHATRADAIYRRQLPASHIDLADAAAVLGTVELQVGHAEAAKVAFERALAVAEQHPDVFPEFRTIYRCGLGEALLALDQAEPALEHFDRAIADLDALQERDELFYISPLRGRGEALIRLGRAHDALADLERARALLAENPGQAVELAHVDWALAQALWHTEGDRQQAYARATSARKNYDELGASWRGRIAEIDQWQNTHEVR